MVDRIESQYLHACGKTYILVRSITQFSRQSILSYVLGL